MKHNSEDIDSRLPLAGLKVLDFGHTVMAPTCGLILADLGAEVVVALDCHGSSRKGGSSGRPATPLGLKTAL